MKRYVRDLVEGMILERILQAKRKGKIDFDLSVYF